MKQRSILSPNEYFCFVQSSVPKIQCYKEIILLSEQKYYIFSFQMIDGLKKKIILLSLTGVLSQQSLNFSLFHQSVKKQQSVFFDSHIQSVVLLITADETFRRTEHKGINIAILEDFPSFLLQFCCWNKITAYAQHVQETDLSSFQILEIFSQNLWTRFQKNPNCECFPLRKNPHALREYQHRPNAQMIFANQAPLSAMGEEQTLPFRGIYSSNCQKKELP